MLSHWFIEKVQEAVSGASSCAVAVLEDARTLLISDTADPTTSFRMLPVKATDAFTHLKMPGEPVRVFNACSEMFEPTDDFSIYTELVYQDRYKIVEVFSSDVNEEVLQAARNICPALVTQDRRAPAPRQFKAELEHETIRNIQERIDIETDIYRRERDGIQSSVNDTLPFHLPLNLACRIRGQYPAVGLHTSCQELLKSRAYPGRPVAVPEVSPDVDYVTVVVSGCDVIFEAVCRVMWANPIGYHAACLGLLLEGLSEVEKSAAVVDDLVDDHPAVLVDDLAPSENSPRGASARISSIGIKPIGPTERRTPKEIRRIVSALTATWPQVSSCKHERLHDFVRSYPFLSENDIATALRGSRFPDIEARISAAFLVTSNYIACARELGFDRMHVRRVCQKVYKTLCERRLRNPTMILVKLSFQLMLDNMGVLINETRSTYLKLGNTGRIRDWFVTQGESGGTTPECAQALGLDISLVSAMAVQLVRSGFLVETGKKRGVHKSKIRVSVSSVYGSTQAEGERGHAQHS